jgi:hypothetical protein
MPAPQASMMQQLARATFTSFGLTVPTNWREPSGSAADHYRRALKPEEKMTAPGVPPLFQPASLVKHHTDTQKMHIARIGDFVDKTCSAVCSAWSQWQTLATFSGFVVAGPMASVGVLSGPALEPLILASAPMTTPMLAKYSMAIASTVSNAFTTWQATVTSPGLPFYPAYAAVPTPIAPPVPNAPFPLSAFTSMSDLMSKNMLKPQMNAALGDPQAPFHAQLFESIAKAIEDCFASWLASTQVTNVVAVASGGSPISPIPAVGTAAMPSGGLT